MWSWLASLLGGPIVTGLLNAYKAKLDAANTRDAQAVDLAKKEIEGEIAARQAETSLLRQEQGWWVTAMIRPLFAAPFIIFAWKVVIWDKVLGWGTTDALDPNMWNVFLTVVGAYFGGRTIEKVARIFRR
mgnify:FL=1|jgi:hypothetical protein